MSEAHEASVLHLADPVSGETVTLAVWGQGVTTRLPRTDRIAFVGGDATEEIIVSWEDAVAVVGHRLRPDGRTPARWTTDGFPDRRELARLRSRALPPPR